MTAAPEGVFGYEWSPDGKRIAYLTRDPMPADEARQRQDKSFVIRADAPDRPTRLVAQATRTGQQDADAADPLRRRFLVVARRPRDRLLGGAAIGVLRAVRHAHLRRRLQRRPRRARSSIAPA